MVPRKSNKDKEHDPSSSLESKDPDIPKPRLRQLVISNFRAITNSVSIDLDDIVILVGPNNSGKSSILKAYEIVMSQGSAASKLSLEDFPEETVDGKYPVIELSTVVFDNSPGDKWIDRINNEMIVRERWIWCSPGEPKREGFDVELQKWSDNVPWGAPNVANSRRPIPHKIDAFDDPQKQAEELSKILTSILTNKIKLDEENKQTQDSSYRKLLADINAYQNEIIESTQEEIHNIQQGLSELISQIFTGYVVEFDAQPDAEPEKAINLFKAGIGIKMGPSSGYKSSLNRHGSGARRTLLWSALKYLEENGIKIKKSSSNRPHLLLIDEPEICLHPSAIRDARDVLYKLPETGNWQVMLTTHSPAFIDLSYDNTTIIRVERNVGSEVKGTTLFRPSTFKLDDDEKRELKLLNLFDPYVAEFFFCTNSIIVEGDTEYTALKYVINKENLKDIHIIRARGKATICLIAKILNQFTAKYAVLHDSDSPLLKTGKKNPAWTINQNIINVVQEHGDKNQTRVLASKINFEKAFLGKEVDKDKPYNILVNLKENDIIYKQIKLLLESLTNFDIVPPVEVTEWHSLTELEVIVNSISD